MKKYFVYFDDLCDEKPVPQPGFTDHEVYLAADVDAHITELRRSHYATVSAFKSALIEAQQAIERMSKETRALDEKLRSLMVK
jgi:uncharacterized coiled-coil protein SlyX